MIEVVHGKLGVPERQCVCARRVSIAIGLRRKAGARPSDAPLTSSLEWKILSSVRTQSVDAARALFSFHACENCVPSQLETAYLVGQGLGRRQVNALLPSEPSREYVALGKDAQCDGEEPLHRAQDSDIKLLA